MIRQIAPALFAACVIAGPLAAQQLQGREGTRFTWSERIPAGQWLRVYGNNGRIQVTEAAGDVAEVVGEKDVRRGRPEDIAFEVRRTSDGVTICAIIDDSTDCDDDGVRHRGRWNRDSNDRRVNFTVRVPRGVHVAAGSGNGNVSVTGATAEVRASSGNGDVRVSDDMELSSGNGRVSITVPANFAGELDASTGSGKFYSDFPLTLRGRIDPHRVRATIGSGGRRLAMRSGNGDVELRKR